MRRYRVGWSMLLLLAGCAADAPAPPDPGLEIPSRWHSGETLSAASAHINEHWWRSFASDELNVLIRQAETDSLDLRMAGARLLQAAASARIAGATAWPTLEAYLDAGREGRIGDGADVEGNGFVIGSEVRYELDVWGRNRALRDAAMLELQASRFDQSALRLTLTAATATQWMQCAGLRQRLSIARLNLSNAQQVLGTVEARHRAGAATPLELAQQRGVVAEQRRAVETLSQQVGEADIALAVLLGVPVQRLSIRTETLERVAWPSIDADMPSRLLLRRPDLAYAEARLGAAEANVRAARAALLPTIGLAAGVGAGGDRPSRLFDDPLYSLSGGMLAPIFNGGSLRAQRDLAQARQMELLADYRRVIVAAFADVESGLNAVNGLDGQLAAQDEQLEQAQAAFRLAESRYRAGAETLLVLLDAQRTLYRAQDERVQLRLARLQASVALYKALGGGWVS